MENLDTVEFRCITGSQHLYGDKVLTQVARDSREIVDAVNASGRLPVKLVFKPIPTRPEEVRNLCLDANNAANCAGPGPGSKKRETQRNEVNTRKKRAKTSCFPRAFVSLP